MCLCREEEDRQMEAAMRASLAMRRQEERGAVQERSTPKHCREERAERKELEEPRNRTGLIKPTNKPPGEKKFQIIQEPRLDPTIVCLLSVYSVWHVSLFKS